MSKIYNAELQKRVRDYMSDEKLSRARTAKNMGIGDNTKLNLWLSNKYDNGDVGGLERDIAAFFELQDEAAAQPVKQSAQAVDVTLYVPTSISEEICKEMRYCQLMKGITMIHGDSGIGKTMAAAKYLQDNPSTAIYIDLTPSTGVLGRFIRTVADKLGISVGRDNGQIVEEIKSRLMGTNTVIIVDEAQNLRHSTLEEIRSWSTPKHAVTKEVGVGIVLIGNSVMYNRMKTGRNAHLCAQQLNRCRPYLHTIKEICKEDVMKIIPSLSTKEREQELNFMFNVCRSDNGIRKSTEIWNVAVNGGDVSYKGLQSVAKNMRVGIM